MASAPRNATLALCWALSWSTLSAQEEGAVPPTPEQLAALERVRPVVEAIWQDVRKPPTLEDVRPRFFWEITDRLVAIGPDVVPFLDAEIDLQDPQTFHFSAYVLGLLGGPEAEAALRKALRAAESRGGRFGQACRRYSLFGLALMGKPDVLDLAQSGEGIPDGARMISDLPLMPHLAALIGPAAGPVLAKQIDLYAPDPDGTAKLVDTLRGLGRAGDASVVPKVLPLLTHDSSAVRAQAADTLSRLGDPQICEKLLPLLSGGTQIENELVGSAIERWKPEPCYKAMIARLRVEPDLDNRASLYFAIAAIGGEASLDLLRAHVNSPNQFERTVVVDAIGRVGSKKGLNMLRAAMTDASATTAQRAVEGIAAIGGEGATDTLLAATADRRRYMTVVAGRILTEMGVQKAAPRLAAHLLELVREPVGNLSLRAPILELSEALVTLRFTDPIDDLKAALAVQADPEIQETLASCVRRLELIAKNRDDVKAWVAAAASPLVEVRKLSDRRLAQIGSAAAVRALAERLGKTDLPPDERAGILLSIADAHTEGAASLVERHLAEPEFDAWDLRDARAAAAWAARRIGGERMARALRNSAVRRDGRDWATLVYLAALEKGAAVDTLKLVRPRRLRYLESRYGREEGELDRILADVAAGRAPTSFDVPPEVLFEK